MSNKSFLFTVTILLFSCHKQLELNPVSQVTTGNYYKTQSDIEQATIACYDALQGRGQYGQNFMYLMEVCSDNARTSSITNSGGIYGDFDLFRVAANNAVLDQSWTACYAGIQRCNILLNRISGISMSDSIKNIRIAEAKFIRGLTYFNMVRIWGDVPIVTSETTNPFNEFNRGRDPVVLVYNQIIKDLSESIFSLPAIQPGINLGRVTKGSAQALLGKVYLTQKNYAGAVQVLQLLVNSSTFQLLPVFADIFRINNKNNRESIFEIQFKKNSNGEGSAFANLFASDASLINGIGLALGDNVPTKAFIDSFQLNDSRQIATIGVANRKNYCKKFIDPSPAQNLDGENNFIVLRYADVLLMLAEALNEQAYIANGDAFTHINAIRLRSGLPRLTAVSTPDKFSFRMAIEKERKYELAFENHRWFDLLRTDRAITVLNSTPSDNGTVNISTSQILFKIPQSQIDVKPGLILQNP